MLYENKYCLLVGIQQSYMQHAPIFSQNLRVLDTHAADDEVAMDTRLASWTAAALNALSWSRRLHLYLLFWNQIFT